MSGFKALEGVKVLSLTQFLLGPSGVQFLSDLGADVIKIEPIDGAFERHWSGGDLFVNGESAFYMLANRNARSVCLNLKSDQGKKLALEFARTADIVVQNFRPGVAERLGLGYDAVKAVNPRVIYVSASGYGDEGPYRNLPGQDLLLQAMTGIAAVTGGADGPPTPVGSAVVDQHGAALLAVGALAALYRRDRSGEGEHVQIIMARAALDLQIESISYQLNGFDVARSDAGLGSGYHQAPYGVYETADGHIALSMSSVAQLATATGNAELAQYAEPRDAWTRKKEIAAVLRAEMKKKSASVWETELREKGVWAQKVNSYAETLEDPVVRSVNPFETCANPNDDDGGEASFLRCPIRFSDQDSQTRRFPAKRGEHTLEALRELGYGDAELEEMRKNSYIYAP